MLEIKQTEFPVIGTRTAIQTRGILAGANMFFVTLGAPEEGIQQTADVIADAALQASTKWVCIEAHCTSDAEVNGLIETLQLEWGRLVMAEANGCKWEHLQEADVTSTSLDALPIQDGNWNCVTFLIDEHNSKELEQEIDPLSKYSAQFNTGVSLDVFLTPKQDTKENISTCMKLIAKHPTCWLRESGVTPETPEPLQIPFIHDKAEAERLIDSRPLGATIHWARREGTGYHSLSFGICDASAYVANSLVDELLSTYLPI